MRRVVMVMAAMMLPSMVQAQSGTATVNSTSSIFLAGGNTYSVSPECGVSWCVNPGGTSPQAITLNAGFNRILTFSSVTGAVSFCQGGTCGSLPDGPAQLLPNTNINASGKIAGIKANTTGFLTGLFLGSALPASAPASLDFTVVPGVGTNFSSLSPLLGQPFFIGDGKTSDKVVQQFFIPDAATTLYLGLVDGLGVMGDPGAYDDNLGSYSVSYTVSAGTVVPEPASIALVAVGLLAVGVVRRRRA